MGHNNVYILDGGLPAWIEAGYATDTDHKTAMKTVSDFEGKIQDNYFVNAQQIQSYSDDKAQIFWMHVHKLVSIQKYLSHVRAYAVVIFRTRFAYHLHMY